MKKKIKKLAKAAFKRVEGKQYVAPKIQTDKAMNEVLRRIKLKHRVYIPRTWDF